jgi:GNAT superfamily N-acetyltransferase
LSDDHEQKGWLVNHSEGELQGIRMTIEYRVEVPAIKQYAALFDTTGWNNDYQASAEELGLVLANSWRVVAAYDEDALVGVGRAITDQVLHAMIYDLIVAPTHQGQGIGSEILERLVQECRAAGIRDVQLFCAKGKREFYEKSGFIARPDDGPGMQMKLNQL